MLTIPLVKNKTSDDHCDQAVISMILAHRFPDDQQHPTMKEVDSVLGVRPHQFLWNVETMTAMEHWGLKGLLIDPFDYGRFAKEGVRYLKKIWTLDKVKFELAHTNIQRVRHSVQYIVRRRLWKERMATMKDIQVYFKQGWYVSPVVNGRGLQGKRGSSRHVVLVTGISKTHIILHNPGLPPIANQKITLKKFTEQFYDELRVWK